MSRRDRRANDPEIQKKAEQHKAASPFGGITPGSTGGQKGV